MNTLSTSSLLIAGLALSACATAAPHKDLVSARGSYKRAASGPAAQYDPADLDTAKKELARANSAFADKGDTQATRDLAYSAERLARIAGAKGRAKMFDKQREETLSKMHTAEAAKFRSTSADLDEANRKLEVQGREFQSEQERRQEAEKRLTQASADLAKFATIRQESRGTVITLSGNVLFASGKSELFPGAAVKLNSVAKMLTQQDPDSAIVVEGHTDSQGSDSYNQGLSVERAEAVRGYLIEHGIAADRLTAEGFGSTRSIADNASAEGRANNRRVEIVVAEGTSAQGR